MLLRVVLTTVAVSLLFGVVAAEGSDGGATPGEEGPAATARSEYRDVVVKLNDDSFSDAVKEADLMLVMFYAEW